MIAGADENVREKKCIKLEKGERMKSGELRDIKCKSLAHIRLRMWTYSIGMTLNPCTYASTRFFSNFQFFVGLRTTVSTHLQRMQTKMLSIRNALFEIKKLLCKIESFAFIHIFPFLFILFFTMKTHWSVKIRISTNFPSE